MARPRTPGIWIEAVRFIVANEPDLSSEGIRRHVEDVQVAWRRNDGPSARTIRLIKQQFPQKEHQRYRLFYWPEAMEGGALPWEASSAGLELLRHYHREGLGRPPIRLVQWYWRVRQLIPEADARDKWGLGSVFIRLMAANQLTVIEALEGRGIGVGQEENRAVEWWLAYAPWCPGENEESYEDAVAGTPQWQPTSMAPPRHAEPIPRFKGKPPTLPPNVDLEKATEAFEILYGKLAKWVARRSIENEEGA